MTVPSSSEPDRPRVRTATERSGVETRAARPVGTGTATPPAAAAESTARSAMSRLVGTSTNAASPVP